MTRQPRGLKLRLLGWLLPHACAEGAVMSGAESPLGTFEEQVMLAVLRTADGAYGMNVRRELELVTRRDIAIGAVYATLDRLEAKGLVGSRRLLLAGASRRVFAVTRAGAQALAESRELRERLWTGVDLRALLGAG